MGLYSRLPPEYQAWLAQRMEGHSFLNLSDAEWAMRTESSGNPKAYNDTGASGLFQQKPATFRAQNVGNDIWDPYQNTEAWLSYMQKGYDVEGSKAGAFGHYFAGPNHAGWGPKTDKYIASAMAGGKGATASSLAVLGSIGNRGTPGDLMNPALINGQIAYGSEKAEPLQSAYERGREQEADSKNDWEKFQRYADNASLNELMTRQQQLGSFGRDWGAGQ